MKTQNEVINYRLLARLASAKKAAAESQHRPRWQDHRPKNGLLKNAAPTRGENMAFFVDNLADEIFWKNEGDASQYDRNINRWYTDQYQNDTIVPAVVSIRNPKELNSDGGHRMFFAASYYSDWDGATIYTRHSYDNARDAARSAEEYAQREAERARDADAQFAAESQKETAREEIHALNRQALELIREIKHKDYAPPVCAAIRSQLSGFLIERRKAFKLIGKLDENYWYSVERYY